MEAIGNSNINKRLEDIEQTLQRLESALLGDKYSNGKGYVSKLDNVEERVIALEKNQNSLKWFIFGSGITGGAGLVKVLETFIN